MSAGLLLDTNAVIWLLRGDPDLQVSLRARFRPHAPIYVSYASFWEIAIKAALGKLEDILDGLEEQLADQGIQLLPITLPHIAMLRTLPQHHRDPFDRMLIAQGMVERLPILTGDSQLKPYDVTVIDVLA